MRCAATIPPLGAAVLGMLAAVLFRLGIYPAPLIATLRHMAASLP